MVVDRDPGLRPGLSEFALAGLVESTRTTSERGIERRIEATDREIDRLVYELYGLTAVEIAIVEGGDGVKGKVRR